MNTISLCMIVKDEEDVIERCLKSVKPLFDEIIIVDTGSTDHTVEIVKKYTDKIYFFEWNNNFSDARNFSFSKASMDYIMWLDADDVISPDNLNILLNYKKNLTSSVDVVMVNYAVDFDKNDNPTLINWRERILKNNSGFVWEGVVHEVITPHGNIQYCDATIFHKKLKIKNPVRNIMIYREQLKNNVSFNARDLFYYARELYYYGIYDEAIEQFEKFFDSGNGWIEDNINACQFLSYCYSSINQNEKALICLFRSFIYDLPRAEICCDIGKYFLNHFAYQQSIYWYKMACSKDIPKNTNGFSQPDCYDFIPYIQLCVAYDRLGNYQQAHYFNELAGNIKPDNEGYLYNKKYFEEKLKEIH